MDDFFRFEDSGDLEEDWSPSNAGLTSPSHHSLARSEAIEETSADEEYSDDFDTIYHDDMPYDDVDTEERQEEEPQTDAAAEAEETAWEDLGPWRPPETQEEDPGPGAERTSPVAKEDPATLWEDMAPWRPPEPADPGLARSEAIEETSADEAYSDDFDTIYHDDMPHDDVDTEERQEEEPQTDAAAEAEETAWEDLGPWRPPETQEEDPGPGAERTSPVAKEDPATLWEDMAPWRPPEPADPGPETQDSTAESTPADETAIKEQELNLTPEQKRLRFEGRSETIKVSKKVTKADPEASEFLERLRELGGGSAGVAWRRLFEHDEVKFDEFCTALVTLHFSGDVVRLWHQLAGPCTPDLKFEAVDGESAAILNAFKAWCTHVKNGPLEVFRAIDQACEGSDSLTVEKFVDGLQSLGFFHPAAFLLQNPIWQKLDTREAVFQNLWPMLDQHCRGCITTDSLLFLEKDPQKRASVLRERTRRRMKHRPPEAHKSEKIIHKLVMETTAMGNIHWSQIPEGHVGVGRPHSVQLPKVKRSLQRAISAPEVGLSLKFLEEKDDILAAEALLGAATEVERGGSDLERPTAPELPPAPLKEERRSFVVPSYRRAYCGSLVPLPKIRKVVKEPKMLMEAQKPRKKMAPSKFDPRLLNSFLTSAQDSIWQHYFGASETSQGELLMLESGEAAG